MNHIPKWFIADYDSDDTYSCPSLFFGNLQLDIPGSTKSGLQES